MTAQERLRLYAKDAEDYSERVADNPSPQNLDQINQLRDWLRLAIGKLSDAFRQVDELERQLISAGGQYSLTAAIYGPAKKKPKRKKVAKKRKR